MGVLGLTPFLQKACPEVIKQLPDRLRSLTGKTIAFDGTLITQRFHFAQVPHPHRHVLGWYRLVKELNECGVKAVCVFDGKNRNQAKALEAERRKQIQRQGLARAQIERSRFERLQKLVRVHKALQVLDTQQREVAVSDLRALVQDAEPILTTTPSDAELVSSVKLKLSTEYVAEGAPVKTYEPREHVPSEALACDLEALSIAGRVPLDSQPPIEEQAQNAAPVPLRRLRAEKRTRIPTQDNLQDSSEDAVTPQLDTTLQSQEFVQIVDSRPSAEEASKTPTEEVINVNTISHILVEPPKDLSTTEFSTAPHYEAALTVETRSAREESLQDAFTIDTTPSEGNPSADEILVSLNPLPNTETVSVADVSLEDASAADLSSLLTSLYGDYQSSIPVVASLSKIEVQATIEADAPDVAPDISMSKHQHQLMLDEGKIWDHLAHSLTASSVASEVPEEPEAVNTQAALTSLTTKSTTMLESFERRTNPPNSTTYNECKEVLKAMGIPCIDSSGPFEAEALAASLVIHGIADYVASEDTDVLMYDAPLIRNITNRQGPLVVVSGPEIRSVLNLDRTSYIDFALLLGTDFTQRIKNVGPTRALKFIRQHGSIERVVETETKFPPRMSIKKYMEQVKVARSVFETLPPTPPAKELKNQRYDDGKVAAVLEKHGLQRLAAMDWAWDDALGGNYFADDPAAY